MYVELGAAIASNLLTGKPKIYAAGEHNSRSMFYFHLSVERFSSAEDVLSVI